VETPEQLEMLTCESCTEAQGYLFSPPLPARDTPALLQNLNPGNENISGAEAPGVGSKYFVFSDR
jgi:predicted signal transduction protein with EAL and GGDEF domain